MSVTAGVDGCPAGWLMVAVSPGGTIEAQLLPGASDLADSSPSLRVIALDLPVGLPSSGRRSCDSLARKLLGWPRSSSVFPAPIRSAVSAVTRLEADTITRAEDGRGVSAQAWGLYRRIAEVDGELRRGKGLRAKMYEAHPELSFRAINGGQAITPSKKSAEGQQIRMACIEACFGPAAFASVREQFPKRAAADDDILDALAVLWTAERIVQGTASVIPEVLEVDQYGLRMAIWY